MLAVGSDDPNLNAGPKVEIHILNNNNRYYKLVQYILVYGVVTCLQIQFVLFF